MKDKGRKTKKRRQRLSEAEALQEAIRLHQAGRLSDAKQIYEHVLQANSENFRALYLRGALAGQLECPEEAIEFLRRALLLQPEHAPAVSELAKHLYASGQLQAAADSLRKLIDLGVPDSGEIYCNLGMVLQRLGKTEEAEKACREAVQLCPESADANDNLGRILEAQGRLDEAEQAYRRAIAQRPGETAFYRQLVALLRSSHKLDEAADVLTAWLRLEPANPVARHLLAALRGQDVPTRASNDYVRHVFDQFADTFDESLLQLDYRVPQLIADAVQAELNGAHKPLDILDAGCGTGLCSPGLRAISRRLVGVDLSPSMIEKARQRQLYDELVVGELTDFLGNHPRQFDLIVAADTFNYFGALDQLLSASSNALKRRGTLVFTLEHHEDSESSKDYQLHPHGRYSHSEKYVRQTILDSRLAVKVIKPVVLRTERDHCVDGLICVCRAATAQA